MGSAFMNKEVERQRKKREAKKRNRKRKTNQTLEEKKKKTGIRHMIWLMNVINSLKKKEHVR